MVGAQGYCVVAAIRPGSGLLRGRGCRGLLWERRPRRESMIGAMGYCGVTAIRPGSGLLRGRGCRGFLWERRLGARRWLVRRDIASWPPFASGRGSYAIVGVAASCGSAAPARIDSWRAGILRRGRHSPRVGAPTRSWVSRLFVGAPPRRESMVGAQGYCVVAAIRPGSGLLRGCGCRGFLWERRPRREAIVAIPRSGIGPTIRPGSGLLRECGSAAVLLALRCRFLTWRSAFAWCRPSARCMRGVFPNGNFPLPSGALNLTNGFHLLVRSCRKARLRLVLKGFKVPFGALVDGESTGRAPLACTGMWSKTNIQLGVPAFFQAAPRGRWLGGHGDDEAFF